MLANSADASSKGSMKHKLESFLHESLTTIFNEFDSYDIEKKETGLLSEYPYFGIIPPYQGSVLPGGDSLSWSSPCYSTTTASLDEELNLSINAKGVKQCDRKGGDLYIVGTLAHLQVVEITALKGASILWESTNNTESETWDLQNKGIRIFLFQSEAGTLIANLLKTIELFIPEIIGPGVGTTAAEANVEFLSEYAHKVMEPNPTLTDPPPADQVKSGDFFGVIRLDGLDPMLAWAMGSTTGHTTVAMWIDGDLYICESTAAGAYWPLSGIQKTPYAEWLQMAQDADYNVVYMPLEEGVELDEDSAVAFFKQWEGVDYGYQAMLWGWIDTVKDNYPCLPPDWSSVCLEFELVEVLFSAVDRYAPYVSNQMWNQAWNLRLGTSGLNTADLFMTAENNGIASNILPTIVESDDWMYTTLNITSGEVIQAPAMVCNVFVCHMWKAGGLFGEYTDEINCGETTNWDVYVLDWLDEPTQILGAYTMSINNASSKVPYPQYAENCASEAPDYIKDPQC
jgi:hypothetical protein